MHPYHDAEATERIGAPVVATGVEAIGNASHVARKCRAAGPVRLSCYPALRGAQAEGEVGLDALADAPGILDRGEAVAVAAILLMTGDDSELLRIGDRPTLQRGSLEREFGAQLRVVVEACDPRVYPRTPASSLARPAAGGAPAPRDREGREAKRLRQVERALRQ